MLRRQSTFSSSSSFGRAAVGFAGIFSFSSAVLYSGRNLFSSSSSASPSSFSSFSSSPLSIRPYHTYRFCSTNTKHSSSSTGGESPGSRGNNINNNTSTPKFSVTELRDQLLKAKTFYEKARLIFAISLISLKIIGAILIALCVYKVTTWLYNYYQRKKLLQEKMQQVTETKNRHVQNAKERFGEMKEKVVVDFKSGSESLRDKMKDRSKEIKDKIVVDFKVIQEKKE